MQGDGSMTNEAGAPVWCAYGRVLSRGAPPDGRFSIYPEHILRGSLLDPAGGAPRPSAAGRRFGVPAEPPRRGEARKVQAEAGLVPREYVCVHPGARASERRWPAEFVRRRAPCQPRDSGLLRDGSRRGRTIAERVKSAAVVPIVDLSGRASLGALGVLLRDARAADFSTIPGSRPARSPSGAERGRVPDH